MLDNQVNAVVDILRNKDLQQYSGNAFLSLIKAIIFGDIPSSIDATKDIGNIFFHMPTLIFWDKMQRFLFGTYRNYSDQIRMAEKFNHDNKKYGEFVKKQINLINQFEADEKVDYFSNLTRAYLFECITDIKLYFKLAKFLIQCTADELEFVAECSAKKRYTNNAMVSALYQYGLFTQDSSENGITEYVLSDFAISLKQNSLNFDDGLHGEIRIDSYKSISPLNYTEVASVEEIHSLFDALLGTN